MWFLEWELEGSEWGWEVGEMGGAVLQVVHKPHSATLLTTHNKEKVTHVGIV